MILGSHTLDETRDLLATADYRFKETGKAYDALATKPEDITQDWQKLSEQWSKDRKQIAGRLTFLAATGFPLPSSAIRTEPEWKQILDYVQYQENRKGSLQDITNRISKLRGAPILYENQPKGEATGDLDLELFKELDQTTRNLDAAADAARGGAVDAVTSNFGLTLIGAVVAALTIDHLVKKNL